VKSDSPLSSPTFRTASERHFNKSELRRIMSIQARAALFVAASLIAPVRLAREEIKPAPRVVAAVADSIRLAEMILKKSERD